MKAVRTSYLNFFTNAFENLAVGDSYWLTYEVTNVSVKKATDDGEEKEASSTTLYIDYTGDNVTKQFAAIEGLSFTLEDGKAYSGRAMLTVANSQKAESDTVFMGLRSFATVKPGQTVAFTIKITLQALDTNGNLFPIPSPTRARVFP